MSIIKSPRGRPRKYTIDKTPEYIQFIQSLESLYAEIKHSVESFEPTISDKKVDLYILYQCIKNLGGFSTFMQAKSTQDKLLESFKHLHNVEHSLWYLKKIYLDYIYPFEHISILKKPRDSLTSSMQELGNVLLAEKDFEEPEPKVVEKVERVDNGTGRRTRRHLEKTRVEEEEDDGADSDWSYGSVNKRSKYEQEPLQTIQLNTNTTTVSKKKIANPDDDGRDEKYLMGGPQSRILLALESGLPNELDWAFTKLIKLSYTVANFNILIVPGLYQILEKMLLEFFDQLLLNTNPNKFETSIPTSHSFFDQTLFFENPLRVLHVLRNLSFFPPNARHLSTHAPLIQMLAKGMALPDVTGYISIKRHCLDIVENLASFLCLRGTSDFFVTCLRHNIFSNDKSLIIVSLRILTILCSSQQNESLFIEMEKVADKIAKKREISHKKTPVSFLNRLFQLLLVFSDEELVSTVLDYLYQYSCLGADACLRMSRSCLEYGSAVGLLCKFLKYRAGHGPIPFMAGTTVSTALKGPFTRYLNEVERRPNPNTVNSPSSLLQKQQQQQLMLLKQQQQVLFQQRYLQQLQQQQQQKESEKKKEEDEDEDEEEEFQADGDVKPSVTRSNRSARIQVQPGKYAENVESPSDEEEAEEERPSIHTIQQQLNSGNHLLFNPKLHLPFTPKPVPENVPEKTEKVPEKKFICWWNRSYVRKESPKPQSPKPPFSPVARNVTVNSTLLNSPAKSSVIPATNSPVKSPVITVMNFPAKSPVMPPTNSPPKSPMVHSPAKSPMVQSPAKSPLLKSPAKSPALNAMEIDSGCSESFASEQDLLSHIEKVHLIDQDRYTCLWRNCGKKRSVSKKALLHHLNTHKPLHNHSVSPPKKPTTVIPPRSMLLNSGDLQGVSLTTLLILRNLARNGGNNVSSFFSLCEADFAVLMSSDLRYSKFVGQILSEIKAQE